MDNSTEEVEVADIVVADGGVRLGRTDGCWLGGTELTNPVAVLAHSETQTRPINRRPRRRFFEVVVTLLLCIFIELILLWCYEVLYFVLLFGLVELSIYLTLFVAIDGCEFCDFDASKVQPDD